MIEATGRNGRATFDGAAITIYREGFAARSTVGLGQKRIPLSGIVSVQWKPATALVVGFIQFETAGRGGTASRAGRQAFDAVKDENSIVFLRKHEPPFVVLRNAVEAALAAPQPPVPMMAPPAGGSLADELAKLNHLAAQGILSPQEFAAAKHRLLTGA